MKDIIKRKERWLINNVCIIGNITKDLELKETESGIKYTRFSIAVNRKLKDGEYGTDFFNIVAWRNNAEFISKYFEKGKKIGIVGKLQTNIYTDKDGNERTGVDIVVNEAYFVEKKAQERNSTPEVKTTENEAKNSATDEDVYAEFGEQIEITDDMIAF